MKRLNGKAGFLMIEAAFFVCILSVLVSASIKKMRIMREERRNEITKQNYETIKIAVASFLSKKNRIPRPAKNMRDGVESNIAKNGYVPYRTLGIERRVVVDGDGHPIHYTPNIDLTKDYKYINYDQQNNDVELSENQYFCNSEISNRLILSSADGQRLGEDIVIAFILSRNVDCYEHGHKIDASTTWLTRDELLMRYLKMAPCRECKKNKHIILNDDDDIF